ncbi:MAG TPA: trehalase family glycosidase, partial [Longimicrobiales bacterium]
RALAYLDALEAEHAFWMNGAAGLAPGAAYRRVVRLGDVAGGGAGLPAAARGAVLNRYWDDRADPRPEAFREDYTRAQTLPAAKRAAFYRDVRASAESGWDFSSRWMRDPADLRTLETTSLLPIDLNSLLYQQERTIAALRRFRSHAGDAAVAARYDAAAAARRAALLALAWDSASGFFYDVRWADGANGTRVKDRPTLAAAAPLYFGLATPEQARAVAGRLRRDFLKAGGFVTTLVASGQQWDAPNGWPPLQWLAIEGLRRYGETALADSASARWLALNRRVYRATGRMTEKYDVVDPQRRAGGGEYPNQDGFGWTNGVALALAGAAPRLEGANNRQQQAGYSKAAMSLSVAGSVVTGTITFTYNYVPGQLQSAVTGSWDGTTLTLHFAAPDGDATVVAVPSFGGRYGTAFVALVKSSADASITLGR